MIVKPENRAVFSNLARLYVGESGHMSRPCDFRVLFLLIEVVMSSNINSELAFIRQLRKRKRYRKSILDKFQPEIEQLFLHGATGTEIQFWLSRNKVKVSLSTVSRWLKKHGYIR